MEQAWDTITNITLFTSIIVLMVFAVIGVIEWITRGSYKKVDKQLLYMFIPLCLMVVTYFIFDKLIILNTRPDGSGEPSFPSSHVLVVGTIFFSIITILPKYVKNKGARIALEVLMAILLSLTCSGRLLANKHDLFDVIGAVILAFIFSYIYQFALRKNKKKNE